MTAASGLGSTNPFLYWTSNFLAAQPPASLCGASSSTWALDSMLLHRTWAPSQRSSTFPGAADALPPCFAPLLCLALSFQEAAARDGLFSLLLTEQEPGKICSWLKCVAEEEVIGACS